MAAAYRQSLLFPQSHIGEWSRTIGVLSLFQRRANKRHSNITSRLQSAHDAMRVDGRRLLNGQEEVKDSIEERMKETEYRQPPRGSFPLPIWQCPATPLRGSTSSTLYPLLSTREHETREAALASERRKKATLVVKVAHVETGEEIVLGWRSINVSSTCVPVDCGNTQYSVEGSTESTERNDCRLCLLADHEDPTAHLIDSARFTCEGCEETRSQGEVEGK